MSYILTALFVLTIVPIMFAFGLLASLAVIFIILEKLFLKLPPEDE